MYITMKTNISSSVKTEDFIGILFTLAEKYQGLGFYHSVRHPSCFVIAIDTINNKEVLNQDDSENKDQLEKFQQEIKDFLAPNYPKLTLENDRIMESLPIWPPESESCSLAEYISYKIKKSNADTILPWLCITLESTIKNIEDRFRMYRQAYAQQDFFTPSARISHLTYADSKLNNQAVLYVEKVLLGVWQYIGDYNAGKIAPEIDSAIWASHYFSNDTFNQNLILETVSDDSFVTITLKGINHFSELNPANGANVAAKFLQSKLTREFFNCEQIVTTESNTGSETIKLILKDYIIRPELKADLVKTIKEKLFLSGLIEYKIENIQFNVSHQYKKPLQKPNLKDVKPPQNVQIPYVQTPSSVPTLNM